VDFIQRALIPNKLPVTWSKPVSEQIVDRVRNDISPIDCACGTFDRTVSQLGKARAGIVLAVVPPQIL
jgi:hypothetical protein